MTDSKLHPDVRLGHVHLRVADLERATAFYRDVLGFEVTAYGPDFGLPGAAFLSAGGYDHHIGLNTWTSAGGVPPVEGHTGLYHDRPREDWFDPRGRPIAEPFDPRDLLAGSPTGDGRNARSRQKGAENVRRKRVSDNPAPGREGAPGRPGAKGSPEVRATPGRESAFIEEQVLPLTNRNE